MTPSAEKYIEYITHVRRYSARTCEIYADVLEGYCGFAGDRLPDVQSVRAYQVHLMDDCALGARTVSHHLSVISGWCRFLVKEKLLLSNPVRLVTKPRQEKRLPEFYRESSMDGYFAAHMGVMEFGSPEARLNYMIVSLLYNTGIRRSELISLNEDSVDFSRKTLRVKGKGDKTREIPLIPSLCNEISLYLNADSSLNGCADSTGMPLLKTRKGGRLYPMLVDRAVKRELGTVPEITGRKSPHVLRHTLATGLLESGTDLNSIKEMLGHSSLAATQVYTHTTIERLQKVYETAHPRAKNGGKNGD